MDIDPQRRGQLSQILRTKLIECGWRGKVTSLCRESIHKHGIDHVNLKQVINDVSEQAKEMVPQDIKDQLLEKINTPDDKLNDEQGTLLQQSLPKSTQSELSLDKVLPVSRQKPSCSKKTE